MWVKALWLKEYHQAKGLFWAIFAGGTVLLTLRVMQQLGHYAGLAARGTLSGDPILHFNVGPLFVFPVLAIALACVQIGSERSHGHDYFTFALPYTRPVIFLSKWLLGALALVTTLVVNGLLIQLLIASSPLNVRIAPDLWPFLVQLTVASLATYTLTLFLGALAGSAAYQAAFGVIFGIFPLGFLYLLFFGLNLHMSVLAGGSFEPQSWIRWVADTLVPYLSVLTHFWAPPSPGGGWSPWMFSAVVGWEETTRLAAVDLALTALFLAWGAYLYSRNRLEYNGLMLVIPGARTLFVVGSTVCFALLGGFIAAAGGGYQSLLGYYLGAAVMGSLAFYFTRKALSRPAASLRHVRAENGRGRDALSPR